MTLPRPLALPALLLAAAAAGHAAPPLMLWGHEASHCVKGVAPELCALAKVSETRDAPEAERRLLALRSRYEADPMQRPAFRTLLYLATEQRRMNANGSGATDSQDDPDGSKLRGLRDAAIQAFEEAPFIALPYLPIPMLKVYSGLSYQGQQPRHRRLTLAMAEAAFQMRPTLDLEAVSFLSLLGNHLGAYDPQAAVDLFTRARGALGKGEQARSFEVALLLAEAQVRGRDRSWDVLPEQHFGAEQVVQALVLMHRTPGLPAADFRRYFTEATRWLQLKRTWVKKQGRWNPDLQAEAWQADAMFDLLKLERPQDAVVED